MPPVLKEMAEAIAETTSTDVAMAATSILSSVSYCFTGLCRMQGKPDHSEPPAIYSLCVAEPSERKSPVMNMIKKPFVEFETEFNKNYEIEIHTAQAKKKKFLLQAEKLEKEADDNNIEKIAHLRKSAENIKNTELKRIAVDDVTPESLANLMNKNNTLLMISDEAGMLANFSGRYSNGNPNFDLILKAFNGEWYRYDRASKEWIVIPKPYLSIALTGQPYIWDDMISNHAMRSSGLLARFIVCFPKSFIGTRKYDTKTVPFKVKDLYTRLIKYLLNIKFNNTQEDEKFIVFDEDAQKEYVEYYNNYIEKTLLTDFVDCKDWGGKYHGLILRICCIIHCIKCAVKNIAPENTPVTKDTLCNAIEISDYYKEHAIFGFGVDSVDSKILKAEKALELIKSKHIKEGFQSEIYKKCRCKYFSNSEEFYAALKMLEEYNYIFFDVQESNNNKPAVYVYVNPDIFP